MIVFIVGNDTSIDSGNNGSNTSNDGNKSSNDSNNNTSHDTTNHDSNNSSTSWVTKQPKFLPIKQCHVDGNCTSNFCLIALAISINIMIMMISILYACIEGGITLFCCKISNSILSSNNSSLLHGWWHECCLDYGTCTLLI